MIVLTAVGHLNKTAHVVPMEPARKRLALCGSSKLAILDSGLRVLGVSIRNRELC